MLRAIAAQPVWHMAIEGEAQGQNLQIDLVKRAEDRILVRISYPPLKLINNQWIALRDESIFNHLYLTRRLTTLRELWKGQERYAFVFDNTAQEAFGAVAQNEGEIFFERKTSLPFGAVLNSVHIRIAYADSLASGEYAQPRVLEDVLGQLAEVAQARNGKPRRPPALASGNSDTSMFDYDFDRDGLPDALEMFYGTDPANPDTDNDTFLDGEEVERGYNPIGEGNLELRMKN